MLYLVLSGNSLQVVSATGQQTLTFPPEVVRYQEIVNKEAFEKLLLDFFTRSQKHEAGIFLDPSLVYHKALTVKNITPDAIKTEEENFFSSVPIASSASANLVVHGESEILLLSTNKHIFQTIKTLLSTRGWNIKFITPLTMFSESLQNHELNYQLLKKFQKQKKLIEKFNFLSVLTDDKPHEKKLISKKHLLLIALMFLCFLGLGVALFFNLNKSSEKSQTVSPTPIITISPTLAPRSLGEVGTPTPTASASATLSKEQIKIQIFNGSGVPGEATKINDILISLGFINIEIGDAEGATSNTTIVIFSERTPTKYREEILAELKKLFSTIETQEIATSDSYDVFITTGESL
jgi:hypothetical protein